MNLIIYLLFIWIRDKERFPLASDPGRPFVEKLLTEKERTLKEQIEEACTQTREDQWARIENQVVRGEPYRVRDIVRMKNDSAEVKKMGKKMARCYSGKYEMMEALGKGWTFTLRPFEWPFHYHQEIIKIIF